MGVLGERNDEARELATAASSWTKSGGHSPSAALFTPAFNPRLDSAALGHVNRRRAPVRGIDLQKTLAPALAVDFVLILLTGLATGIFYHLAIYRQVGYFNEFVGVSAISAISYCAVLGLTQSQRQPQTYGINDRARDAIVAWCIAFSFLLFVAFTLKLSNTMSRGFAISFFGLGLLVTTLSRINVPVLLARVMRAAGLDNRGIILVGSSGDSALVRIAAEIGGHAETGPTVLIFDAKCPAKFWPMESQKIQARIADAALTSGPGQIFVSAGGIPHGRLVTLMRALNKIPRTVLLVPDPVTSAYLQYSDISCIGSQVAVEVQKEPLSFLERGIKRSIDIVLSVMAIVFLAPLLLLVAALVKLDSPGPVFFCQRRNGFHGTPFKIIKFRTMSVCEDGSHVVQARKNDPRVTRIGGFLRKSSIDELPQLFCVLKGDMSLIGPRPHAVAHDEMYSEMIENYELRQHVKPGITGWAQVNGLRGETRALDMMYRRIEMDIWYATNCTLLLDLKILVRTVIEVLRQRNAY